MDFNNTANARIRRTYVIHIRNGKQIVLQLAGAPILHI